MKDFNTNLYNMICFSTVRNLAKSNYDTLLSAKNTRLNTGSACLNI